MHVCHPDAGMVLSRERGADVGRLQTEERRDRGRRYQELAVVSRKPRTR